MRMLTTTVLGAVLLTLAACSSEAKAEAPATANATCPMMGNEVEAGGGTTTWHGMTVGFCCPKCKPKFEALSDAEKQAKLEEQGVQVDG